MAHSDPAAKKEYQRKYYLANRAKALAQMAVWREANPEKHAAARQRSKLWVKYGLTPEAHRALNDQQDGMCAVCGKRATTRALHVDHDHETGVVRGLLCNSCNRGIGLLQDNPAVLRAALAYLEAPRSATG